MVWKIVVALIVAYCLGWYFRGVLERRKRRDKNVMKTLEHRRKRKWDTQVNVAGRFHNLLTRLLPPDIFVIRWDTSLDGSHYETSVFPKDSSECLIRIKVHSSLNIEGNLGSERISYKIAPDNIRKLESDIRLYLEHL